MTSQVGVDFEKTDTAGSNDFPLGSEEADQETGIVYKRVRFAEAKTAGSVYILGYDFTLGNGITTAGTSVAPLALGVPQVALEAPDDGVTYSYGWVAIRGPLSVLGSVNHVADTEVYTTSLTGIVGSLVTGAKRIEGFKFTSAVTQSLTASSGYAVLPLGISTDI